MASEDTVNPLAYLDYSQLNQVIVDNWELFEATLIHRPAWDGRQEELARIRHRIGHMRRPHPDDLGRLEQTLRDIERGAFIAQAFYNHRRDPDPDRYRDAVTAGWLGRDYETAQRLIDHAEQQYGTSLQLSASQRPWVSTWPESLTNASGILWHATFMMRDRAVDIQELWNGLRGVYHYIVHLLADSPSSISFTFAAVDDDQAIADAIGRAFDAVLLASDSDRLNDTQLRRWQQRAIGIDYRIIHETGWNVIDESTLPIDIFGAGGGVTTG